MGASEYPPVAIVGMAVLLPGAADLEAYWHNLVAGVDSITPVPEGRWDAGFYRPGTAGGPVRADEVYCRRGGFVDDLATIEVTRYGITPSSVSATEPDQLLALRVAASAIADAGGEHRLPDRTRVGVILGRGGYLTPGLARLDQRVRTAHQLVRTLREVAPTLGEEELERVRSAFTEQLGAGQPSDAIGLVPNLAASRIANRLDLRGPAYTVDAACASSLIAVDQAAGELASGRCDAVLAGGVHHCHDITLWSVFSQLRALSASERIRPFDRDADGILIGEGSGVVLLKRLADAERAGDRIYAVIRGSGVASDGRAASPLNPDPDGQVLALRRAWEAAGLDATRPGAIGLLEAHGTATPAGDLAELTTLKRVFGGPLSGDLPVIGSVKSMIGHAMPAAGIAGLVKAALAVHRGVLLPTLHCDEPHPALAETRFRPLASAQPWWPPDDGTPRRAAVNAFGFGGINAHVVLEQHGSTMDAERRVSTVREPERLLRLSARTREELAELLDAEDSVVLARDQPEAVGDSRIGIVGPTARRLALARKIVAKPAAWRGRHDIWFTAEPLLPSGKVVFVFPGLEADFQPHVDDVAEHFGLPRPELTLAGVGSHAGSVLGVGRLLDAALRRLNIEPGAVAGHSVGEWTAMIVGGIHDPSDVDALLVDTDLDSMRVPGLEFAVVGCGADEVAEAIADIPEIVVSHDNSPHQTIVCGAAGAVAGLVRAFRARNVVCQVLPFRSGFHTPMLRPYLAPIESIVDSLPVREPAVPVWSATTASPYPLEPAAVRDLYLRHLLEPVRFRALVQSLHAAGFRAFVQVGPGQLGSLIDDTLPGAAHLTVSANSSQRSGLDQLRRVATAFWVDGGQPDFRALASAVRPPEAESPQHVPVRLDLGTPLISLGWQPRPAQRPREELARSLDTLGELAGEFPEAAEITGLLRDTADAATAVIRARNGTATVAAPARQTSGTSQVLLVSTEAMPYLLDHCFAAQRKDWPDETDLRPVVPATTVVRHMIDAAERATPGTVAVAVEGVRLMRWLVAAPAVEVPVTVEPVSQVGLNSRGDAAATVTMGDYAQATVVLSARYPAEPRPWAKGSEERPPAMTAEQFYGQRWMFHGPRLQGITELTAIGKHHVRAVLTTPDAPGGLLDNVGQLFGYWIVESQRTDRVAFPVHIGQIELFGAEPEPGTRLDCEARVRYSSPAKFVFDAQLTRQDRVWAHITGWQDQRFDSHEDTDPAYRQPERHTLARRQPGDWFLLPDQWTSIASRDLYRHKYLSAREREAYEQCPPYGQRHWLLGRIAAKDAVRGVLWDRGWGPLFPAEILVTEDQSGRPVMTGQFGLRLPRVDVALAHCRELAVAIARRSWDLAGSGHGVGIHVDEIRDPPESTVEFAMGPGESKLLASLCEETGESSAVWFTRFWCAKEAVSKAVGTSVHSKPRRFVVLGGSSARLLVKPPEDSGPEHNGPEHNGTAAVYDVPCAMVSNPPDLPARDYVVAWTTGPAQAQAGETSDTQAGGTQ